MSLFILVILTLLPGSWFAFGLPLDAIRWRARLALAVALSPAVLGIQLVLIKLWGIEFAWAAFLLAMINLPSLFLLWRSMPPLQRPRLSAPPLVALFLFSLLAAYSLSPKVLIPNYRAFSWHALFHVDIIYQLTRHTLIPEEPEMAGLVMSYGWLDHVYWSVLGWLTDWSPTAIYSLTSLIWLLVAVVLAYELVKTALGLHPSTALVSVGLLFLGTNLLGASIWLMTNDLRHWVFFLGDGRYTPFLGKYVGFETMPFAFALLLGLTFVCLLSMQRKIKQLGAIVAALLIALGLLYPILFPVGCLLVAGLILLLGTRWGHGLPQYTRRDLALLSIGLGVSLVIFFGYLELVTQDRVKSTFQFTVHEMQMLSKGFHLLSALLPLALVASPFVIKSVRNRSSSAILLAATALGLMVLYIFANLTNLEYKLIFGATIFLFPLSAAGLDPLFLRSPRWRWFWAMAVPLLLIAIHLLLMYRVGARLPRNLANAPTLHEGSFWIALDQDEQDAAWIQTVRNATPEETILVARDSQIHLGPFVFRSLYLPSDADGVATAGYSVPNDYNMLEWRGYSAELYRQRLEVVDTIYRERDPTKLTHALTALRRLNRPVAIHFSDDRAPALAWLKQQAIGCALFADDRDTVWFIHSAESDCSTPTAVTQ